MRSPNIFGNYGIILHKKTTKKKKNKKKKKTKQKKKKKKKKNRKRISTCPTYFLSNMLTWTHIIFHLGLYDFLHFRHLCRISWIKDRNFYLNEWTFTIRENSFYLAFNEQNVLCSLLRIMNVISYCLVRKFVMSFPFTLIIAVFGYLLNYHTNK